MAGKVLIVDDDKGITEAFEAVLQSANYETLVSLTADEIEELIKKFKPDVILLDVLLSGKDGRDVCRELKKDSRMKKIPVIIVSAHPAAKNSVREAGADSFLAKPFEMDDLLEIVKRYVKK